MASFKEKQLFEDKKDRKVVQDALETLINNEKLSDTQFAIGIENKIYYGIRALFAMNSSKFNQLLYHNNHHNYENDNIGGLDDDDDKNASLDQIIHLNHISPSSFEFIQSYFYQNPKKLSVNILVDVLLTAKEFELSPIEKACNEAIDFVRASTQKESYLIHIANELYNKGKYEMCRNILSYTKYVLVQFIFISLTHSDQQTLYNKNKKPIFYAVAMAKHHTVNDLKGYVAVSFATSVGQGSKDVIICTTKHNTSIFVQDDDTNIMDIINECIVVYYCPKIILQSFDNDEEKTVSTEVITIKIYNKSMNDKQLSVAIPFAIRIASFTSVPTMTFKKKIAEIVGLILNDNGYITIKDGNIPFEMKSNKETIAIEEFTSSGEVELYWKQDIMKYIKDTIWTDDICESNKSKRLTAPIHHPSLKRYIKNCKWIAFLPETEAIEPMEWEIQDIRYIQQNLRLHMDNATFCDVKFEIGKPNAAHKTFYGISALFAVQSTVFEAQFFGGMLESRTNDERNIRLCSIDDLSPDTFEFLREYFYNLDPAVNTFNAVEIVYASTKYLLPALQYPVQKFISSLYGSHDTYNIYTCLPMMLQLYEIGFHDMSVSLLNKSVHLYRNAYNAMEQQGFLDLPLHILKVLVCCDEFGADEIDIYNKVREWAQYQIKKHGEDNVQNIIIGSANDEEEEKLEKIPAVQQLMNQFKYSIRWMLIPWTYYKENECGSYCLNKEELKWIGGVLIDPTQHLMVHDALYSRFKCYYRDYNKHISDTKCISYKYFTNNNINNDECTVLQFVYIDLDYNEPNRNRETKSPTFYGCIMDKSTSIDEFRAYCSKRFDVVDNDYCNIFVCLVLEGKIFHVFNVMDKITELNSDKYLICVYYSPLIEIRSIKLDLEHDSDDDILEEKEKDLIYPYPAVIDGWNYRWNYRDDIQRMRGVIKEKKKKQHLLSIVHIDPEHKESLKPLCGVPLLLNLYCESKVNLFTLQKHYLSNIARIIMDDELYKSVINSTVHSIKFIDEDIKKYFNIIVRQQFMHYTALDTESQIKLNKSDTQNLLCLQFQSDQIHHFKKSFVSSIKYCRKHITAPPTSMEWTATDQYTERKMIRVFRTKPTMRLKSKPREIN